MNTADGDVELLSRAILSEAQAESQELQADAQSKADAIRQRAQAEGDRERKSILEQAQREAERLRGQAIATAQLKARSAELEHREKLLDQVFEAAKQSLPSVPKQKDYEQFAIQLVREGITQLNTTEVEILADEVTRKVLAEPVIEQIAKDMHVRLTLGKTLEQGVGVILQTPKGHLQFNNTLETRLGRLRSTLRAAVYGKLMGESK
jgi:vacuolar-type H+-ATPase subunit E/Vma4